MHLELALVQLEMEMALEPLGEAGAPPGWRPGRIPARGTEGTPPPGAGSHGFGTSLAMP